MQKRSLTEEEENETQDNLKRSRYEVAIIPTTSTDLITTENQNDTSKRTSDLLAPTMLLTGHEGAVYSISFDPTGQHIASGSFDNNIFLWNTFGECENYGLLSGHKNAVLEVHWGSNGNTICSASADKTVGLWDAKKGTRIRRLINHTGIVNTCSMASNQPQIFASGSDDRYAIVWDSRSKIPSQSIGHDYQITSVCLSAEGDYLYTGGIDNIIRRWDTRMISKNPHLSLTGHGNTITGLSLNPEGTHLLSNGMDSNLFLWDIRPFVTNEQQRYEKKYEGARHGAEQVLLKCNWSPTASDGLSRIACGSADRIVHIWDATTTQQLYYLPGHKGSVNQVIFHPTQPIIASCGSDKQIFVGELS